MTPIESIPIDAIRAARGRIRGLAVRTPLLRLELEDAPCELYLKPENLQPIGSFKLRGAANAMAQADADALTAGVYTASAGNMAQGVGYVARARGIPWSVVVPDHAPTTKLAAIERLGGRVVAVPFERWWTVIEEQRYPGLDGLFIHPVCDPAVIAGNGTVGLEIVEDLPDVDAIVVPYGGGGLTCGIASAVSAVKPGTKVFASEVETATPLRAALAHDEPTTVTYEPTFVDGIGSTGVLPQMWPLVRGLVDGSIVVGLREIADAIRLLVERARIVAEGAGGSSVAAAMSGQAGSGKVVCVVSGGNLDTTILTEILAGRVPGRGHR